MWAKQLRKLVHEHGPFASVYLDASHDTGGAAAQLALRWRMAETQLRNEATDQPTLAAVAQRRATDKARQAPL